MVNLLTGFLGEAHKTFQQNQVNVFSKYLFPFFDNIFEKICGTLCLLADDKIVQNYEQFVDSRDEHRYLVFDWN